MNLLAELQPTYTFIHSTLDLTCQLNQV